MPMHSDGEQVTCELIVMGHGGAFRTAMAALVPKPTDKGRGDKSLGDTWVQELGRVTTYLRRYLVNSFFALDTVEDKDSEGVQERPAARQKDARAETPAHKEAAKEVVKPVQRVSALRGEELRGALIEYKNRLGWDKAQLLEFIDHRFSRSASELTEAEKAQLLGMMTELLESQGADIVGNEVVQQ